MRVLALVRGLRRILKLVATGTLVSTIGLLVKPANVFSTILRPSVSAAIHSSGEVPAVQGVAPRPRGRGGLLLRFLL